MEKLKDWFYFLVAMSFWWGILGYIAYLSFASLMFYRTSNTEKVVFTLIGALIVYALIRTTIEMFAWQKRQWELRKEWEEKREKLLEDNELERKEP